MDPKSEGFFPESGSGFQRSGRFLAKSTGFVRKQVSGSDGNGSANGHHM